jgi:hypothetical protein
LLGPSEFSWIQALVDRSPELSQCGLGEQVCHHFGWRRPNGEPPSKSCSVFLRRLVKRGFLRLPNRRQKRSTRHPGNDRTEFLRFLGPLPGMVECQPSDPLWVRPITPEEWDGFWLHLERYHYLGFTKPVGESLCYAAFLGRELVALLVWGAAVLHNGPRDRYLGWDTKTRTRTLPWVVNNRRFLVLPWVRLPHLASRILGANLRRLSRDWQAVYGHPVLLAETFVDTSRFRGTCYRASNWIYLGQTRGFSRTRDRGFAPNGCPKAVFVFPLHRRALARLRAGTGSPLPGVPPCTLPGAQCSPCSKSSDPR